MDMNKAIQFLVLRLKRDWWSITEEERVRVVNTLGEHIKGSKVKTHLYLMTGYKPYGDILLWRISEKFEDLQEDYIDLMKKVGNHLHAEYIFTGFTRQSMYVKKPSEQDNMLLVEKRDRFIIVYPFTKTTDWYLMSKDARQGMMNEHIRVGRGYPQVKQLLVYSFGIDDQEFVVAYETDDLYIFQELVMALRETEARKYTLKDTPIITGVYRPLEENLKLLI